MPSHLKHVGVSDPDRIERYSLRTESENDILKIYYRKAKGDLFQKSLKLKFPRQQKRVLVDSGTNKYENTSEIAANLVHILEELDGIADRSHDQLDTKSKILKDLRHLERVVANKIDEIERELAKL